MVIWMRAKISISLVVLIIFSHILFGIQAYFTEYGPLTSKIIDFIRSSKEYVFISSFDINHPNVISELTKLKKTGVDVRIITEKPIPNLPSKIDYSKGLHHVKFIVNENGVVFGSANFTDSGLETGYNDIIIFPSNYSKRFKEFFLNLWNEGLVSKVEDFLVSPIDKVEEHVVKLLLKARKKVWVCVYAFTDVNILTVLKYKSSQGVDVRIITDKWFYSSDLSKLPMENINVISDRMLHHKFIIVDDILITGSTNYTESGFHKNVEMIWITKDKWIVREYEKVFKTLESVDDKNSRKGE
ncbi:MAG TPA: phospholipase D-like domain-containing protein [Fervidobacterium nodosum]|nr:phospholipase D-like domain-containing protein [Fervidobacterium nodosum]